MLLSEFKKIKLKVIKKSGEEVYYGEAEDLPEDLKHTYAQSLTIHANVVEAII